MKAIALNEVTRGMTPEARRELDSRLREQGLISAPEEMQELEVVEGSKRPWHVLLLRFCTFTVAYFLLGLGWLTEHIGRLVFRLGEEMKAAARNID